MILPLHLDPPPGDLGVRVLVPGTLVLAGDQRWQHVDATVQLLAAAREAVDTDGPAWRRYRAACQGGN